MRRIPTGAYACPNDCGHQWHWVGNGCPVQSRGVTRTPGQILTPPPTTRLTRRTPVVVALDLDNTTVDFTDGFRRFLAHKNGLSREESLRRYPEPTNYGFHKGDVPWFSNVGEFLENFREAEDQGLYRNLEAYSGAVQSVRGFMKDKRIDMRVVTARDSRFNEDTSHNLRDLGIHISHGEIINLADKEDYPAHIFVDDKDDFAERIHSGAYVMPDGVTKRAVVLERGYNRHVSTARDWGEISDQLNSTVDTLWGT